MAELLRCAELGHGELDTACLNRGNAEHRKRYQHEAKLRIEIDHVRDVLGSGPAVGAIKIIELDQRDLASRIDRDHDAEELIDWPGQPDGMIGEPVAIVGGERQFRHHLHRAIALLGETRYQQSNSGDDRHEDGEMFHDHCATTPVGAASRLNAAANRARV